MKKLFSILLVSFGLLFLISEITQAQGIVPCGQPGAPRCELSHIFVLILNVYNYVLIIATSLAGLGIVIGGILIMISGGGAVSIPGVAAGPNLYSTGTKIISGSIFGIVLIWGAWLIINTVLLAIGYAGP